MSDHCDGRRFFNPHRSTDKGMRDLLRFWSSRGWPPWPERVTDPPAALAAARAAHGVAETAFRVPGFGETLTFVTGG